MAAVNELCDTPMCPPVHSESRKSLPNRLSAIGTSPVFRFRLHTLDREFSCPENGGGNQNRSRVPDILWNYPTDKDGDHGSNTNTLHLPCQAKLLQQRALDRSSHCCSKPDRYIVFKPVEWSQNDTPVASRTRSKTHSQDTASKCMVDYEEPYQLQFAMETRKQFLQLNKQADDRHIELSSKIQTICDQQRLFSEQQASMILELRKELAALMVQKGFENAAIGDQLVKPNQNGKLLVPQSEATSNQTRQIHHNDSIGYEEPESNSSSPSTLKVTKILDKQASAKPDSSKLGVSRSSETNERTIRVSPSSLSKIIPKQPIRLGVSKHSSTEHFALTARTTRKPNKSVFPGDGDASVNQSSEEQDTPERYRPGRDNSRFHVPSAPKEKRRAARNRIVKALDHCSISNKSSSNHNGKRMSCDLYVGNLAYKAGSKDLMESISPLCCSGRLHLERASVPQGKGRNRGYGFITLSWPRDAQIDPADICTNLSGVVKVHSRPIYLCATENSNSSQSNDTSANSESAAFSDRSEHEYDNASQDASDYSESQHDTSTVSTAASDYSEPDYEDVKESIEDGKAFTCRINYPQGASNGSNSVRKAQEHEYKASLVSGFYLRC